LQKWRKQCKLTAIPKLILPLNEYQFFINDRSDSKRGKDVSTEHFKKISTKELQKVFSTMYDQKGKKERMNTGNADLKQSH